jgi:Mrp family chromosome partitioning ATPase
MNETTSPETFDLRAYIQPIRRRWWVVALVAVVAAAGAYFVSSRARNTYVSSTQVYIEEGSPTAGIGTGQLAGPPTPQQLQDIATLVTAQSITTKAYRELGMPIGSAGSVSVSPQHESSFITLTAESHSAAMAARLANTYVSAFLGARRSQVVGQAKAERIAAQAALATLSRNPNNPNASAQRQTLLAQIAQLQGIELNPSVGARQIDAASIPGSPSSPKPTQDAIFGGVIGLVFGVLIAFGLDLLDNRLISVSTIETIFKRPVLAVLPHVEDPAPAVDGQPAIAREFTEAMRTLRVGLRLANRERPARTILVTSGLPGEGKSTVARALALIYAEAGERVLLISADLRRPGIAHTVGVDGDAIGLSQVLRSQASLADAVVAVPASSPGVASANGAGLLQSGDGHHAAGESIDVLPHGERVNDPVTLLSSQAMGALLTTAKESYDMVILDTAPLVPVSDTMPLLEQVDVALMVVRLGQTTRGSADRGAEIIGRIPGVNLAGVVVNDLRRAFGGEGYSGYEYYGYSYDEAKPKAEA